MNSPRLDAALDKLQRLAGPDAKPLGTRVRGELEYGAAYQELVRAGLKPQLRGKYRLS